MTRLDYISEHFSAWLERYAPPRFLADKPERMQAEADTLLRIVGRYAPAQGYAEWLDGVLRSLTEGMTARTWPTGGEVTKACTSAARSTTRQPHAATERDAAQITAGRMAAGEAVGEAWLYGVQACELIARGLVDQPTMDRYRSAAYHNRASVYGAEQARRWEDDAKARHEAAKAIWRERDSNRKHQPATPTGNRMPTAPQEDFV